MHGRAGRLINDWRGHPFGIIAPMFPDFGRRAFVPAVRSTQAEQQPRGRFYSLLSSLLWHGRAILLPATS
jgi:hypothetical protein